MRARVFLREPGFRYACELDAADADDMWRQLEAAPSLAGRGLRAGDIVYLGDEYLELNGDGGWVRIMPGPQTEALYRLAASEDRGVW